VNAGKFDDHATVVVLEFLVRRLIVEQCRHSPNPQAALRDWSRAVEAEKAEIERYAFGGEMPAEATTNAIIAIGEFDRILGEIAERVAS
jgi:hypothetical protein